MLFNVLLSAHTYTLKYWMTHVSSSIYEINYQQSGFINQGLSLPKIQAITKAGF